MRKNRESLNQYIMSSFPLYYLYLQFEQRGAWKELQYAPDLEKLAISSNVT